MFPHYNDQTGSQKIKFSLELDNFFTKNCRVPFFHLNLSSICEKSIYTSLIPILLTKEKTAKRMKVQDSCLVERVVGKFNYSSWKLKEKALDA